MDKFVYIILLSLSMSINHISFFLQSSWWNINVTCWYLCILYIFFALFYLFLVFIFVYKITTVEAEDEVRHLQKLV